ncbi:MAG: hypothetical protein U5K69_13455 [Balneolaceae bacterium]|nr:hypothetical protein [Balneolaceae bacterium]
MYSEIRYPVTFEDSRQWLAQFLEQRFSEFGDYQDAILKHESFLNHSLLTPMLNTGLITPQEVLNTTLDYAENHDIPLNTLEGFIRQIVGWREFIRAVYELEGHRERTENFWRLIVRSRNLSGGNYGHRSGGPSDKARAENGICASYRATDGAGQLHAALRV